MSQNEINSAAIKTILQHKDFYHLIKDRIKVSPESLKGLSEVILVETCKIYLGLLYKIKTSEDIQLRTYIHKEGLRVAERALTKNPDRSYFALSYISFSRSEFESVVDHLRSLKSKFNKYVNAQPGADDVYQFGIQLIPMVDIGNEKNHTR